MDTKPTQQISVLEPIGAAIDKTKQILFQPFNIGKWFILGFIAWLATWWERAGGNGGNGINFNLGGDSENMPARISHEVNQFKDAVLENLPVILFAAAVFLIVAFVVGLVLLWIKSRFQFIFLSNVAHNDVEIANRWKQYSRQGNSLFLFKLVLGLFSAIISVALVIPLVFILIAFAEADFKAFAAVWIIPAVLIIFGFLCFSIMMAVINILTKDFVVPIMYLRDCTLVEGWGRFWRLARQFKGKFILFLLVLFVLNIVMGIVLTFGILAACCCFCFIAWVFFIPVFGSYLFTVLTLPLWVWRRAWSALFLAQFGPEFDVFAVPDAGAVPADATPLSGPPTEQNF